MATFPPMRDAPGSGTRGTRSTDDLAEEQKSKGRKKRRRRRRRGQAQPYSARDFRENGRGQTLSNILRGADAAGKNPADANRERLKKLRQKKEADKRGS